MQGPINKDAGFIVQKPHGPAERPTKAFTKDEDQELILRFFAFTSSLKNFKRPIYQFLNAEIQQKLNLDAESVRSYEACFKKTFDLVEIAVHACQNCSNCQCLSIKQPCKLYNLCSNQD